MLLSSSSSSLSSLITFFICVYFSQTYFRKISKILTCCFRKNDLNLFYLERILLFKLDSESFT